VRTLIDARMPAPDPHRDRSPLTRRLLADGLISGYPAGGAAVTPAPFHPVGAGGRIDPDLYLIGVPTEGARWFTQIGNGRPGPLTSFHSDADAVVRDLLATARARNGASSLAGELVS
jgi:hypothetical protein